MLTSRIDRLSNALCQPVDMLPLAVFRIAFGALMCLSSLRFMLNGWVDAVYIQPDFHFKHFGFGWLQPLPGAGMHVVFVALAALAALVMLGWRYRLVMPAYFLVFTWVELLDQATYLNHYYFISLVSFLFCFLPAHGCLSLDARRDATVRRQTIPRWQIAVLQLQVVSVYFFAGFAKLNADWLLQGLPMRLWLRAHSDFPLFGHLFDEAWLALLFSWAGALYDLTIPLWLLWRRTRALAFAAALGFHAMTALLFPIGVFPWVMAAAALIFFPGADFRWLFGKLRGYPLPAVKPDAKPIKTGAIVKLALCLFFVAQLILPLRHYVYPGDANWTMEGYRFAWRVMLNEKAGFVTFRVVDAAGKTRIVHARRYLTEQQARHMAYQPDMIWQFAQFLGGQDAQAVYAEAWVTHNGRPARLLIDPGENLLAVSRSLSPAKWILP